MHDTMETFGYPATLIKAYEHWCVLLRPAQVTLGALILVAKADVKAFSELPAAAFAEQAQVVQDIERVLAAFSGFQKMNYMMLMMVDPHVHYHVLPRYEGEREFDGLAFADAGWPALPRLDAPTPTTPEQNAAIVAALKALW
ncbi:MAG: HIT family protein [Pseudomonadota bacterium]